MKPAWEAACDFNDACRSWLDEGELRRLSRLLEGYERYGRRSRDAEVAALTAERDEATALLRQSVDLISAGVLAAVFGGEMTPQAEERINRLVDDLRAFLKKTEGDAS